jgi:putative flippase GtrA
MKKLYQKYKKGFWHFIKFQCVGVVNFVVDYGVFTLLNGVVGWPVGLSNTISYSCGIVNSFLLNRYWTFKLKLKFFSFDFLKFVLVNVLGWGVNTLTMIILVNGYSLSAKGLGLFENLVPKLIATALSFVVNFAGSKLLVFREDNKVKKQQPEAEPTADASGDGDQGGDRR